MILSLRVVESLLLVGFLTVSFVYGTVPTSTVNLINIGTEHLDLSTHPILHLFVHTSRQYRADTTNDAEVLFVGEFSSSGPHFLAGPWNHGYRNESIGLDRDIGKIQSISINKYGHDEWLISKIDCEFAGIYYEFKEPTMWLNQYNENLIDDNNNIIKEDGMIPFVQDNILSSTTYLQLLVEHSFQLFEKDGSARIS